MAAIRAKILNKVNKCRLIVFDFDGVMTDNRVLVSEDGKESVFCNRSDGIGVNVFRKAGYRMLILSTEANKIVKARADKLKIPVLYGIDDKKKALAQYCGKIKIKLSDVVFIGNDINDLEAMQSAGLKIAPRDARREILNIADYVTKTKGGYGVIREIADLIK